MQAYCQFIDLISNIKKDHVHWKMGQGPQTLATMHMIGDLQRPASSSTNGSLPGKFLPSEAIVNHTTMKIGCVLLLAHAFPLSLFR